MLIDENVPLSIHEIIEKYASIGVFVKNTSLNKITGPKHCKRNPSLSYKKNLY
jgi:hypothetical protein